MWCVPCLGMALPAYMKTSEYFELDPPTLEEYFQ